MSNLDPLALMTLTKAIDFLFNEAGKVLEERRLARRESDASPKNNGKSTHASPPITSREEFDHLQPRSIKFQDVAQEVEHYLDQIHKYRENLRLLQSQASAYGGRQFAPLIVQNQIANAEQEIFNNCQNLKRLVEKAYGEKILIDGLD